jgi:hypothetical protein
VGTSSGYDGRVKPLNEGCMLSRVMDNRFLSQVDTSRRIRGTRLVESSGKGSLPGFCLRQGKSVRRFFVALFANQGAANILEFFRLDLDCNENNSVK